MEIDIVKIKVGHVRKVLLFRKVIYYKLPIKIMNTITKINLSNIKKCNQYWENMPENEKGRLCLKCNNTIIDFRRSTDAEIAQTHVFSEQKVCGMYRKEQLELSTRVIEERKANRWKALYLGLFSFLSLHHYGQENKTETNVEQTDKKLDGLPNTILKKQDQDSIITKEKVIITGIITDEKQIPLPGAYVIIVGTKTGANSNQDGFYRLDITDLMETQDKFELSFRCIGYEKIVLTYEKAFFENIENKTIDVQFTEENINMISFYVYEKVPFHKRVWYKVRNIFRRK